MKRPHIEHDDGFLFLGRKLSALRLTAMARRRTPVISPPRVCLR
jgi:hypothetical protein